ncbi:thiamine biosynthesis lipoprotein [Sphingobium sp. OAS761]|uniref:FAD:protein FMN transferase n=1 Tax=Sphingobium sp. OAS761 TaxID=2817901 RepID=UPI00209D4CF9|nr:FAD:protein FMN transferase [Sphingobium sp. OAS761]MCP1470569.1 thiamine biosynthesis lipoprotein [Sphingobium sp. OAS761]
MGTSWNIHAVDPPAGCADAVRQMLSGIIDQMSNWEADSVVTRFNSAPVGGWMTLPPEMLTVLRAGLDMAALSDGAFDPAIGRMVDHWGFGPLPGASSGPCYSERAPWRCVEIGQDRARRIADVTLDFSGIAKGFAVDMLADLLRRSGVADFLVEIGGELRGEGIKPGMQPWWVDVEAPPGLIVPTLRIALCGLSVATSGDYRRFRIEEEKRLSHSIDPATGRPIPADVASVTVLHESAMMADAWATAITVAGPEKGMALATREGLAARLVRRDGDRGIEYMTPALAAMLD